MQRTIFKATFAGGDGWIVAAASRLQIFFNRLHAYIHALAVGLSDTLVLSDSRRYGNGFRGAKEPRLLAQCTGKRQHLATMIPFAIGTGARKSEQLTLKVRQCDFFGNLIIFDKSGRKVAAIAGAQLQEIDRALAEASR